MARAILAAGLILIVAVVWGPVPAGATMGGPTIRVPRDYGTIQSAIDGAPLGATIMVSPGVYGENLDFHGKALVVRSTHGQRQTIIDGGHRGPVVTFSHGEGLGSRLQGFTLRNGGDATGLSNGGGVEILRASPSIVSNVIEHNVGCAGAGIDVAFGSPTIQENVIRFNQLSCTGGGPGGGGINVRGDSVAIIRQNRIVDNIALGAPGGGVSLFSAGNVTVTNNFISGNEAWRGGGLWLVNAFAGAIVQNIIVDNEASSGGGLFVGGQSQPVLEGNTIADNPAPFGSAIFSEAQTGVALLNDIAIGSTGETAVLCGSDRSDYHPPMEHNDVFSPGGAAFQACSSDPIGRDGNISVDPEFVNPSRRNFALLRGSPSIDAGLNSALYVTTTDFLGRPRIVDGDGDGLAIVDQGALEAAARHQPDSDDRDSSPR